MSTVTAAEPPLRTFRLTARGKEIDLSDDAFGFLRTSADIAQDGAALRGRMAEDGYLYMPGLLNRDLIQEVRHVLLERLNAQGWLHPGFPQDEAVVAENRNSYFMADLAKNNAPLFSALYDGPMMAFFERLLGGAVRHFDYTWMRVVTPGNSTAPHCDIVYMGRGTPRLYTAWTPLGDIDLSLGGLMVLENSHRRGERLGNYLERDVDSFCANGPNAEKIVQGKMNWESWEDPAKEWDGAITHDAVRLREQLGGRWLTAPNYRMGDVLVFSMRTVHASLDNPSNRIRLSSDTRYQRADEPADERWIGEQPIAHGVAGKRGRIC
jgi:ectoine hydroxylase-related dioxygenase (phytanoyl-CoA dioxygenase family)